MIHMKDVRTSEQNPKRKQTKKSGRKMIRKLATFAVLLSTITAAYPEMHPAVRKVKESMESKGKTEQVEKPHISWKEFSDHLKIYERDPLLSATFIGDHFSEIDDSLKQEYFNRVIKLYDKTNKDNPSMAFMGMCEFIEKNFHLLTEEQARVAFERTIEYGTTAMNSLPLDLTELRTSYREGIDTLRAIYKRLFMKQQEK